MKLKAIRNPFVVGVVFYAVYMIGAWAVPNTFPASSILELLIPVFVVTYVYVYMTKENLSRKQIMAMVVIWFIITTILAFLNGYFRAFDESGAANTLPLFAVIAGVSALFAALLYALIRVLSNKIYQSLVAYTIKVKK